MSLDKSIKHSKEKRKPYRGAKAIDHTCRNHGTCPYCEKNRTYSNTKNEKIAKEKQWESRNKTDLME